MPIPSAGSKSPQVDGLNIQHIDAFGNLISDVRAGDLSSHSVALEIRGHTIHGLSRSYAESEGLLAIIGSLGYVEIAVKNGSAARELAAQVGDTFRIRLS